MKSKFKKYMQIYSQFGLKFSIKYFYYKITHKDNKYIDLVYNYLLDFMSPIIKKYNEYKGEAKQEIKEPIPVWVCWWQGYDKMPELCKMLYNRLKKMLPQNAQLMLITLDNYLEYASIPQNIVEKYNKGLISYTFYSDILRSYLIRDNGGLWIDASIYVSKKIPEDFLKESKWWSINLHNKAEKITNLGQKITERKWSGFIQRGTQYNVINSFLCDAYELYYEKHDHLIEYFMQNILIKIAYDNIPYIKNIIDDIPVNNCDVYSLYDNIDMEFDKTKYDKWNDNTTFYKLTQKRSYNVINSENKTSFYGAIKEYCDNSEESNYEQE